MALHINIEDLLDGKAVENNRLDYKEGWNPNSIYRTICAFANDFEDTGGGYIVVGVEEQNGRAVRPVKGIDPNQIESIEKEMVGFNNLIMPYYQPRLFIEETDGKTILIIKVTAGERRPYKVPDKITAKQKTWNYYIRYNSSCIVPKNEYEEELRSLANRVPFDDRGNADIKITDISTAILRDHLVAVKSALASEDMSGDRLWTILDQMDLTEKTPDGPVIRNVAAMMFSEQPDKFFKYSQVEIVIFPEGRQQNPNNMIELPVIKGPVPRMIRDTMNALKVNVIRKNIRKQKFDERSITTYNYPYQALEEAVVNSLYHRDYQDREPVEITVEPDKISILSFSGPNYTISMNAIHEGKLLRSRRYRNRRLGEFLKELDLTEGRSTGIPTIQEELASNGSPAATIETDEARTYFIIDIPCHPEFKAEKIVLNGELEDENCTKDCTKEPSERQRIILDIIAEDGTITAQKIAQKIAQKNIKLGQRTLMKEMSDLQKNGFLKREGGRKDGIWIVNI